MNKFKFLLTTFLFFFFVFSFPTLTQAANLNIDCTGSSSTCNKTGLDPLFSNSLDEFWYPGKSITKTLNLKNSGSETREMAINGTRASTLDILENTMHINIVKGSTIIWSGSVADFYAQDKIKMGIFAPGSNLDYDFTLFMSSDADNNYQNKETIFDLTLGSWEEPISTPTEAPTTTSGGGGAVLGAGVSTPICTDTAPGGAPTLTSVVGGVNSATLTWTPATDPVTYYLITYGTTAGVQTYGNPNVGGHATTSYTVNGLSGGTTYYFRIRAGNGCMPGPYSNELSATAVGRVITAPAAGFVPGVLGAATQSKTTPSAKPQVLGTANQEVGPLDAFPWWLLLIIFLLIIFLAYITGFWLLPKPRF